MNSKLSASPVEFSDVLAATERLRGLAVHTPLLSNPTLDAMTGANVLLKPECLQRTGSFKFRGACNRLGALSEEERRAGVVAYSSGNHAQGVAAAAQHYGVHATIVMPADAPAIKIERTRGYGAEVIRYDRYTESREAIGEALARETGAVLVRPYDDPYIIAGQGTAGLELAQQAAAQGAELDAVLVCCGGGGLTAGIAVALAAESPKTQLYAVEPEGFDDHARSLASGRIEQNDPSARSICDALLAPEPGELTFSINRRALAGGLVVSDEEARAAMRFAFEQLKLVLEPGGAVALAAVLSGKLDVAGKTVGVVLSGGNVAPDFFVEVLTRDS